MKGENKISVITTSRRCIMCVVIAKKENVVVKITC